MSEEQQRNPTLTMWERVLRIRQQLYNGESSSIEACEGTLASGAMSLKSVQEELMKKAMGGELHMPFNQWELFGEFDNWSMWNPWDNFGDCAKPKR